MKVLIIEDELPAAKRLQKILSEIEPGLTVLDNIVSVESGIDWFANNEQPDLIFSDIQLSDGISFDIFKTVKVTCPVIFITAFDRYAIEAFMVHSIDYLLKPIKKEKLVAAIEKYKFHAPVSPLLHIGKLLESINIGGQSYKQRFIVRYGEHIKTINIEDVVYFYTENKVNFLCTKDGHRYVIDHNLDNLDSSLDPENFFRINRQYIIGINAIAEMFSYSKSRVLIKLNPPAKHETIVSAERSADFKQWLAGEK